MPFYKTIDRVIEAQQFDNIRLLKGMEWDMGGAFIRLPPHGRVQYVWPGEWVIPAGDGHYYTMSDKDFKNTYEPVINKINYTMDTTNEAPKRELTFGEKAVGITLNPSNNKEVEAIKRHFADTIDYLNDLRKDVTGEKARLLSVAITDAQSAQMFAVKAVTWQY